MALLDRVLKPLGYQRILDIPKMTLPKEEVQKSDEREGYASNPLMQAFLRMNNQNGLRKPSKITFQTLRKMSQTNWVDRTCITTLRDEITALPWDIAPANPKESYDQKFQQYVINLLKKPNPNNENWRTFIDKIIEDILVCDAGCIEKVRNNEGQIVELWTVDGATIKPCFDEHGVIGNPAYQQFLPGQREATPVADWRNEDLIYMMWNPQGSVDTFGFGLSPVESGLAVGTAFLYAEAYNLGFFRTNTIPPVIINMGKEVNNTEVEKFRAFLAAEMMGDSGFHTPIIGAFGDGFEVKNLMQTPKDMAWKEYVEWQMRWKVALYRMSPQDIGFTLDQYKVEGQVQQQLSQNKAINSLKNVLKHYIDTEILLDAGFAKWANNLEFQWIDTETPDPQVQANVDQIYLQTGKVSINELRIRDGQDPILGGQQPFIVVGQQVAKLDATPMEDPELELVQRNVTKHYSPEEGVIVSMKDEQNPKIWMDDRGITQPLFVTDQAGTYGITIKPDFLDIRKEQEPPEQKVSEILRKLGCNTPEVKVMSFEEMASYFPMGSMEELTQWIALKPPYDSMEWRQRWGDTRKANAYIVTGYISGADLGNDQLQKNMAIAPESYKNAVQDFARIWIAERLFYLGDRKPGHYIVTKKGNGFGVDYQFFQDQHSWEKTNGFLPKTLSIINTQLQEYFLEALQEHAEKFGIQDDIKKIFEGEDKKKIEKELSKRHNALPDHWERSLRLEEIEKHMAERFQRKFYTFYHKAVVNIHPHIKTQYQKAVAFDKTQPYITNGVWVFQNGIKYSANAELKGISLPSKDDFLPTMADYRDAFDFGAFQAELQLKPNLPDGIRIKAPEIAATGFEKRVNYLADTVSNSVKKEMDRLIAKALDDGLSYGEIADSIQTMLGVDPENPTDMPGWRAMRIARTESVWANNEGMREQFKAAGITRLDVSTAPTACPICIEIANHNPYNINEVYNLVPVHPNCRCVLVGDYTDLLKAIVEQPEQFAKGWVTVNGRHLYFADAGGKKGGAGGGEKGSEGTVQVAHLSGISYRRADTLIPIAGEIDRGQVANYKKLITNGHPIAPLVVVSKGNNKWGIVDGNHRNIAMKEKGITLRPTVNGDTWTRDQQDAYDRANLADQRAIALLKN